MKRAALAALVLFSTIAAAEPLQFGNFAPLTNTRYGTRPGVPLLATNGTDLFLLTSSRAVRITRVVEGERRTSRVVLRDTRDDADIVWTGTHFLLAASAYSSHTIVGQLLDRNGEPVGAPFTILTGASRPRLAWNGRTVLMIHRYENEGAAAVRSVALSATGKVQNAPATVSPYTHDFAVATNGAGFAAVAGTLDSVHFVTFDTAGNVRSTSTRQVFPVSRYYVDIASDEYDYLAAWTQPEGNVTAIPLSQSGVPGEPFTVDETQLRGTTTPSLTWSAGQYVLVYRAGTAGEVRVARLSGHAAMLREPPLEAYRFAEVSTVAMNGRAFMAWQTRDSGVNVRDLFDPGDAGLPASFGAADQEIVTSATAAGGTLFVWVEWLDGTFALHAGVRELNGDWSERRIVPASRRALAATDGREFLVVARDATGWVAARLGANGRLLGAPVRIAPAADEITSVVWNGERYAIAMRRSFRAYVALLDAAGAMGTPVPLQPTAGTTAIDATLAYDGRSLLAVWLEPEPYYCGYDPCFDTAARVVVRRLGPSLEPLEAPLLVESTLIAVGSLPRLFVTPSELMVVWNGSANHFRRFTRAGARLPDLTVPGSAAPEVITRGGTIVFWRHAEQSVVIETLRDGAISKAGELVVPPNTSVRVVPLPDERLACVTGITYFDPPHHAAARLMINIGGLALPPPRPAAPGLIARASERNVTLEWTPPPGPVNGYRVEYRIGDGTWNELDRWLGASTRSTVVRVPAATRTLFRIRAWNDRGAGAYSDEVAVYGPRRRAVR